MFGIVWVLLSCAILAMVNYTNAEMADMHLAYGAANGNARRARRIYQERYPNRRVPSHPTFTRIHRTLSEIGRFDARSNVGGHEVARIVRDNAEDAVLNYFQANRRASIRSCASDVGISRSSVWRILHNHNLHAFHYQRVQALQPQDLPRRVEFAEWFLNRRDNFSKDVLWSDEAYFSREGIFNTHNLHEWHEINPHIVRERAFQQRFSINVWAGILNDRLIGPYILPSPLTGHHYSIFLRTVLPELLEDVPLIERCRMWFQHDGAPAHFHRGVTEYLNVTFPNRWIGRNGPVHWPARSPDLNPLDFFFWGHMKQLVYETPVETEVDLMGRIVAAAGQIAETPDIFSEVRQNFRRRLDFCIAAEGGHFEHVLDVNN